MNLGVYLNSAVGWDHFVWNWNSLVNGDTLFNDGVVFHAATQVSHSELKTAFSRSIIRQLSLSGCTTIAWLRAPPWKPPLQGQKGSGERF